MTTYTMGSRMQSGSNVGVANANTTLCVDPMCMCAERTSESPFHFSLRNPRTPNDRRQPAAFRAARRPAGRSVSRRGRSTLIKRRNLWRLGAGKRSVGK